jgi:hypothetical protein
MSFRTPLNVKNWWKARQNQCPCSLRPSPNHWLTLLDVGKKIKGEYPEEKGWSLAHRRLVPPAWQCAGPHRPTTILRLIKQENELREEWAQNSVKARIENELREEWAQNSVKARIENELREEWAQNSVKARIETPKRPFMNGLSLLLE